MKNLNIILWLLRMIPLILVKSAVVKRSESSLQRETIQGEKGTDDGLYNEGFFEGDIYRKKFRMKNAVADSTLLWPDAAVIYRLDKRIGCPDSQQCAILMKAFDHYHKKSCIRFKEWSGENHYVRIFFNPDSGACWSAVGKTSGGQLLSLGQRCWYLGIVIHELGHTVGFWHEMNRPDRDEYISIHWKNILPGFTPAFTKHDEKSVNLLGEDFDFTSIMMYDEFAFSKDGASPTIHPKDDTVIGPIWKKPGLSSGDVRRLHKLYDCEGNNPKLGFPADIHCSFDENPCGFKSAGGNSSWSWRNINRTDGYVYSSAKSTSNDTGYFMSVNFHPLDVSSEETPLGCVRFWYLIEGEEDDNAVLILRQSYLQKVTQLLFVPEDTFDIWESDANFTGQWVFVELPLYVSRPFKLIFESEFEGFTESVIALDDLEILYSPCSAQTASLGGQEVDETTTITKSRRKGESKNGPIYSCI